jgi:tRNA pseudouridine13 synthase
MRESHPVEQAVGIEYYVSEADGTGGRLRGRPEDFRVRERESFDVDVHPVDADSGSYPHLVFRAKLSGWDTNDFASALSNKLGISRERVSWAGTKDKHAITTQLFSVKLPDRTELPDLGDADVEILGRAGRPVLFGDLAGNEFELVVREAERPENATEIAEELRAFAGDGNGGGADAVAVPNYFGHQRFGSRRPITHRVGLDVVRGDWESAAVRYVCESSGREPEATRETREWIAEGHDWNGALDRLPRYLGYERAIAGDIATF